MNARERLIDSMAQSLRSAGYHNTGLNQIVADSGAPKGSMYHYFPGGKVELAAAAVDHSSAQVAARIGEILQRGLPPMLAMEAVIEFFAVEMETSAFTKGCPVATIALEEAATTPQIRDACARAYDSWQSGLAAYLTAQAVSDPDKTAETFLMLLEGALLMARARLSAEPLRGLKARLPLFLTQT
jgi:TetR/AcrR family transcriptional repressor of lmrAB and yxaGH operons